MKPAGVYKCARVTRFVSSRDRYPALRRTSERAPPEAAHLRAAGPRRAASAVTVQPSARPHQPSVYRSSVSPAKLRQHAARAEMFAFVSGTEIFLTASVPARAPSS